MENFFFLIQFKKRRTEKNDQFSESKFQAEAKKVMIKFTDSDSMAGDADDDASVSTKHGASQITSDKLTVSGKTNETRKLF